jgi:hypothetical protein
MLDLDTSSLVPPPPRRLRRARPLRLNTATRCVIIGGFALGLGPTAVARLAQVAPPQLIRWLARGRKETEGAYCEFATMVDAMRALHPTVGRREHGSRDGEPTPC